MSSTMLERLKSPRRRGRFHLPKKGRIRALLVLLLIAGGARFLLKRGPPGNQQDRVVTKRREAKSAIPATVKTAPAPKSKKTPKPSVKNDPGPASVGGRMDEKELSNLLIRFPHILTTDRDTIALRRQTLVVHSAIDPALQSMGTKLLAQYRPRYGAVVAIEPGTGRIRALVSYTGDSVPSRGDHLYCRSVFPAASIFKTVTAAAALERAKLRPESCLPLAGQRHTLYYFQLRRELGSFDEVTLEEAFAYSINPVFARIGLYVLHAGDLREYAGAFGFNHAVPFVLPTDTSTVMQADSSFAVAELASGFNRGTTLSPLMGAMIAASIVEDGTMPIPVLVDSIVDAHTGRGIYRGVGGPWRTAVRAETAAHLRRLMVKVVQYGTARNSFRYVKNSYQFKEIEYGGKTGSVNKEGLGRVDWFVGFVRHPDDARQRLAVSVVTAHGDYWTVHSSFVAAELLRQHVRTIQSIDVRQPVIVDSKEEGGQPFGG